MKKHKRTPGARQRITTMDMNHLITATRLEAHADPLPGSPEEPRLALPDAEPDHLAHDLPAPLSSEEHIPEAQPGSPPVAAVPAVAMDGIAAQDLLLPLEERIRKLEEALATLQDTQRLESRVAEQVTGRITKELGPAVGVDPTAGLLEIGKRLVGAAVAGPRLISPRPAGKKPGWLLTELVAEARVIGRMYVDPRYQMTWVGRLLPVALLIGFLWADWVLLLIPLVNLLLNVWGIGWVLIRATQLLLAYAMFKLLSYEARRYRETSPDLPPSLRL